ncbi:MAG: NADH-quinone oxidoreductase subunit J [Elusimicrobia bacterium]|nr:NADH-quinone oxidoreductase subunit J [Elusimicrobiota bacterium]
MILDLAIYLFGGLAIAATVLMIFQRDAVKAALLMLAVLLCTAVVYLALSAQLLAILQVILYAGAIMTLFIVALTALPAAWRDKPAPASFRGVLGLAAAAVLLAELLKVAGPLRAVCASKEFAETGTLGLARLLFGPFVFQFELLSLVILASIVAAVTLTARRRA